jgi:tetratricopeptide (TPR) repeat protein
MGVAAAAALGVALAISGITRTRDGAGAAADTAIVSHSIAFFEGRLAGDPRNPMIGGQLVARYLMRFQVGDNLQDVRRAEAVAREIMPLQSDTAGALARLGLIHLTQHQFAPAYDAARHALRWNPRDQAALGLWFDAAMAMGRYAEADSALGRLRPGRLAYQLRRAHYLTARGALDGAYYAMDRACHQLERASAPAQVTAWCLTELAKLVRQRESPDAAATLLERALSLQPGYRGAIEGLADLAYARGDWREAMRHYARIVADAHPDLYLRIAEVSRELGDTERAAAAEREFLRVARAPDAEPLYAHPLAIFYAEQPGMRDSAVTVARRDVARRPAVESWDVLSWVLFRRGSYGAALAASDRAVGWGAPSATMEYHRACILEALGRDTQAAPLFQRALARPDLLDFHIQRELRGAKVTL